MTAALAALARGEPVTSLQQLLAPLQRSPADSRTSGAKPGSDTSRRDALHCAGTAEAGGEAMRSGRAGRQQRRQRQQDEAAVAARPPMPPPRPQLGGAASSSGDLPGLLRPAAGSPPAAAAAVGVWGGTAASLPPRPQPAGPCGSSGSATGPRLPAAGSPRAATAAGAWGGAPSELAPPAAVQSTSGFTVAASPAPSPGVRIHFPAAFSGAILIPSG